MQNLKRNVVYASVSIAVTIAVISLLLGFWIDKSSELSLQEIKVKSIDDWPAVFKQMDQTKVSDMQVVKGFTTQVKGVTGWVVKELTRDNSQALVYTVGDGKYAVIGGIIDSDGNNLSSEHFERFADAVPTVSANRQQETDSLNADLLQPILGMQPVAKFGNGSDEVIVVIDINCPYCTQYFNSILADSELLNDFTFLFMPVGILSQDSVSKAAVFDELSNEAAKQHLADVFAGKSLDVKPSNEAMAASEQRTMQWQQAGLTAVPSTIINLGKQGQVSKMGMLDSKTIRSLF